MLTVIELLANSYVIVIIILFLLFVIIISVLQAWNVKSIKKRLQLKTEARKVIVEVVAVIALIFGARHAWDTLQIEKERLITERFTRAVEMLGNKEQQVRIGAIYALERIS